jgi:serine protease
MRTPSGLGFLRLAAIVLGVLTAAMWIPSTASAQSSPAPWTHHPIYMPAIGHQDDSPLQPPPVYTGPIGCVAVTCVWPIAPAGQPTVVNMAYFGGKVEVKPEIYLVLYGWGRTGAFNHTNPDMPTSDPDGAGQRMIDFIGALGGTAWAGSQTQYYETVGGKNINITNPPNQLAGVWWDNTSSIKNNMTGLNVAQEAERALNHFENLDPANPVVIDRDNAQFVIATPQRYNEKGFNSGAGYCAWHDNTTGFDANGAPIYPGTSPNIAFTNMPYVLNSGSSCGQNAVNAGAAGTLDGFTMVVGHEIEETVTDPGAEEKLKDGTQTGAWFDFTGYENADKCAWVGLNITGVGPNPLPIPGAVANITGSDGKQYAVQSLWSNDAGGGTGYCAGNGNDLPA